jgi:hypothetical protein
MKNSRMQCVCYPHLNSTIGIWQLNIRSLISYLKSQKNEDCELPFADTLSDFII